MNVVLFGATGMIGSAVLEECLADDRVARVLSIGRRPCGRQATKLEEVVSDDLFDHGPIADRLAGWDACLFCLGVSSAGMNEARYHRITYDVTLAAARTLQAQNPDLRFCYVSAAGADSTETSRVMWARVRGKTENDLLKLGSGSTYIFRPAYIHPVSGTGSRTRLYRVFYVALGPLYPLLKRLTPGYVTTTERFAKAMIQVAMMGFPDSILESREINAAADKYDSNRPGR